MYNNKVFIFEKNPHELMHAPNRSKTKRLMISRRKSRDAAASDSMTFDPLYSATYSPSLAVTPPRTTTLHFHMRNMSDAKFAIIFILHTLRRDLTVCCHSDSQTLSGATRSTRNNAKWVDRQRWAMRWRRGVDRQIQPKETIPVRRTQWPIHHVIFLSAEKNVSTGKK